MTEGQENGTIMENMNRGILKVLAARVADLGGKVNGLWSILPSKYGKIV